MSTGTLTLILGGVRSGKSRFAEQLAASLDESSHCNGVLFVATAQAFDSEMKVRIAKHQDSRPTTWRLLEQTRNLGEGVISCHPAPQVVLIDCLPLLITNVLCDPLFSDVWQATLSQDAMQAIQDAVNIELDSILNLPRSLRAHIVIVSGEVGMGLVPENAMGRAFRDLLGWANQRLAQHADATYFLTAGHAVPLKSFSVSVQSATADLQRRVSRSVTSAVGFLCLLASLLSTACNNRQPTLSSAMGSKALSEAVSGPETQDLTKPSTVTITDKLDRKIEFKSSPKRIISLSPSTTELLFAMGLGPSVVGVTEHCNFPAEALALPRVGSGTLEGISREAILSLSPDLVLCKWDSHQPLVETFEKLGVPIVGLGPETLSQMFDEARLLGRVTNQQVAAERLILAMEKRLIQLKAIVSQIGEAEQKRVFYQVWDSPLMTAGPKSFIGELLETAKLKNVFHDLNARYTRVSSEVIVERDPEIILAPTTHSVEVRLESFASRPGWDKVAAVRDQRIYIIDGDQVSRCGPRLLDALEQMIQVSYPASYQAGVSEAGKRETTSGD
jgi:iron complex transport system substrate-binding protein